MSNLPLKESEDRVSIISNYPLFQKLDHKNIIMLNTLTFEKKFKSNQVIVKQGDIVDSVYLIAEGEAEVAKESRTDEGVELIPEAVLRRGESIGLDHEGFFSKTGIRTATVTSLKEVVLIGWNLDVIQNLLNAQPQLKSKMQETASLMLRMGFIKKVLPFESLPPSRIRWLADHLKEVTFEAGKIIMREGEKSDVCYLIASGEVEVYITQEGVEKKLAVLGHNQIFGEASLLTHYPRNASVRMLTDGKLLVLYKDQLHELLKHREVHDSMMTLMVERCRPVRQSGISVFHHRLDDGESVHILKDGGNGRYFQLSDLGWVVWQNLDGKRTLDEITEDVGKINKGVAPQIVADTILNLSEVGFVHLPVLHMPLPILKNEGKSPGILQQLKEIVKKIFGMI